MRLMMLDRWLMLRLKLIRVLYSLHVGERGLALGLGF